MYRESLIHIGQVFSRRKTFDKLLPQCIILFHPDLRFSRQLVHIDIAFSSYFSRFCDTLKPVLKDRP